MIITPPLHYTCIGDGPDVLLIHGWASSSQMWSRLMHDLKGEARFWAVDLYGFGESPRPEMELPDIETHTALLIDFCDQHGIRPAAIMGHSMGGMLTLKLALARPDLAERLVLMSSVVTGSYGVPIEISRLITSSLGSFAVAKSKPFWMLAQSDFLPSLLKAPWYMDEEAATRTRLDFKRTSWQAAMGGLTSIARENLEPHLPALRQPTLVIVGKRDLTVPTKESYLAAKHLPNSRLVELPRSHHHPLDEEPTRTVGAIHDFLRERHQAAVS